LRSFLRHSVAAVQENWKTCSASLPAPCSSQDDKGLHAAFPARVETVERLRRWGLCPFTLGGLAGLSDFFEGVSILESVTDARATDIDATKCAL
jgi:hypothetical protein